MTYCVAIRLDSGLVFLSDSRTNAGVDQISTFRKMHIFEMPGEQTLTPPGWTCVKRLGKGARQPTVCFFRANRALPSPA